MSEPTSAMSEEVPGGYEPPPEPRWQRFVVPGLAMVAVVMALVAFGAWRQLNPATREYDGQRIVLAPADRPASPFQGFAILPERPAPDFELTDQHGQPWRLADQRGSVTAVFFGYTHCPDVCPQTMQRLAEAVKQLGADAADVRVALITVDPERDRPAELGTYVANFNQDFVGLSGPAEAIRAVAEGYGVTYVKELPPAMATQAAMLASHDDAGSDAAAQEGSGGDGDGQVKTGHGGDGHDGDPQIEAGRGGDDSGGDDSHGGDGRTDGGADGGTRPAPFSVLKPGTDGYTVAHSGVVFLIDRFGQLRSSFLGPFTPEEVVHDVLLLLGKETTAAGSGR